MRKQKRKFEDRVERECGQTTQRENVERKSNKKIRGKVNKRSGVRKLREKLDEDME